MQITLNGAPHATNNGATIADLLAELGHGERRVAVEVNRAIVPRGRHTTHVLQPGDTVELVQAMGGG